MLRESEYGLLHALFFNFIVCLFCLCFQFVLSLSPVFAFLVFWLVTWSKSAWEFGREGIATSFL